VRLALFVEYYSRRGFRVLPVTVLKRLGFTRRQWELATKGTRQYVDRKLVSSAPASDGLEATGLISEHTEQNPKTGIPATFWVIGAVDADALAAIRAERENLNFDVIEDRRPEPVPEGEPVEHSVNEATALPSELAYNRGYAHGHAAGYDLGVRDLEACFPDGLTGCVKDTSLRIDLGVLQSDTPESDLVSQLLDAADRIADAEDLRLREISERDLGF